MEWKYKILVGTEFIKLYDVDKWLGSLIVERDQNGRIIPERTHAFVRTYEIELGTFYRSLELVKGIRDQDKRDLTVIVKELEELGPPDKSEDRSRWLRHRNMVI